MTYEECVDVILPTPDGLGCEFRAWKPNKYHTSPSTHVLIEKSSGTWLPYSDGTYAEMLAIVKDFEQVKLNRPDYFEELLIVPYPEDY